MIVSYLPWPPKELSPNGRKHWAEVAKIKGKYKVTCGLWLLPYRRMIKGKIPVSITFRPPDRRRRDLDNMIASFKAGQDAIAHMVGIDDYLFRPAVKVGEPVRHGIVFVEFES